MPVDLQQAAWLKSEALYALANPSGVVWDSDRGVTVEMKSPIDARSDALTEADRHAANLGGPNVKERALVKGRRRDLMFKCVTLVNSRLGYSGAGKKVFVLGVAENDDGTSTLTVLRKL